MASREERMQQRLRGAQRRHVKDVDFGIIFTAATVPLRNPNPNQQSPQLVPPSAEIPPQSTTRRRSASRSQPPENSRPLPAHNYNDANTSAKRRKLDTDVVPPLSGRSTRSSPNVSRPAIHEPGEQKHVETPTIAASNITSEETQVDENVEDSVSQEGVVQRRSVRSTRTPSIPAQTVVDEVMESPTNAPGSGQRKRTIVRAQNVTGSELQSLQASSPAELEAETPVPQRKRKRAGAAPNSPPTGPSQIRMSQGLQEPSANESDELSPEQPVRRRKGPKAVAETQLPELAESIGEPEAEGEAEPIDNEEAAVLLKKNRGRRTSRNVTMESPRLDEAEMRTTRIRNNQNQRQGLKSSPAKQRHPKAKSKAKHQPTRKSGEKSQLRAGSPIPVIVHRLTGRPIYDGDDTDADILNSEIPKIRRGGVNAVDVLSQICLEIVGAGLDTLGDGANSCDDSALRREYRTKWLAVKAFGEELQNRLLEHTISLDNAYSLDRRIRDEQRKKVGLRDEILRVRAEREQVALRMDEIRIQHEVERHKAQERDTLNFAVHDIELAIELGKRTELHENAHLEGDLMGTELLLKRVAGEVSNKSDTGGLLRQMKDFNALLERAALALEGRLA